MLTGRTEVCMLGGWTWQRRQRGKVFREKVRSPVPQTSCWESASGSRQLPIAVSTFSMFLPHPGYGDTTDPMSFPVSCPRNRLPCFLLPSVNPDTTRLELDFGDMALHVQTTQLTYLEVHHDQNHPCGEAAAVVQHRALRTSRSHLDSAASKHYALF